MADMTIRHVAWRDGRPRFVPGKHLRKMKYEGEDLRHPDGRWFTYEQAKAWSEAKVAQIEAHRQARQAGKRAPPVRRTRQAHVTVDGLFEAFFTDAPKMQARESQDGKRRQRVAAPATIADYKWKRKTLVAFDPVLAGSFAAALTQPIVYDLYERIWARKGLATARGCIAVLSLVMSWGIRTGKVKLPVNPCKGIGMETPEPRLGATTVRCILHLIATADAQGKPEIGDCVALGVWSGQRQKDRLELTELAMVDGRRMVRQSKTGAVVELFSSPQLDARLEAAKARRKGWPVVPLHLVVDERNRVPFSASWYRQSFMKIRDKAAETMPELADFTDMDLRDTAVTWLARANCTLQQICMVTGHSLTSATRVLRHYLSLHREMGDEAIARLIAWYDLQDKGAAK